MYRYFSIFNMNQNKSCTPRRRKLLFLNTYTHLSFDYVVSDLLTCYVKDSSFFYCQRQVNGPKAQEPKEKPKRDDWMVWKTLRES